MGMLIMSVSQQFYTKHFLSGSGSVNHNGGSKFDVVL